MSKTSIKMSASERGFSLETSGNSIEMGLMLGLAISSIMSELPKPLAEAFRLAVISGYKGGEDNAENETVAGDSQTE